MPETRKAIPTKHSNVDALTLYRGYNALVACAVLYQYTQTPQAAALEYLPDVAIHLFEALAPRTWDNAALIANGARALQAGFGFFSKDSTIPQGANFVDVFNHAMNIGYRASGIN